MARDLTKELPPDIYLSPAQLAERIPYSVKALGSMRDRNQGPPWIKRGKRVFYRWADVVAWLEEGRRQLTSNNSRPAPAEPRSPESELGRQGDEPPGNGRGPPPLPAGKNSRDIRHPISGVRETSEKGGNLSHPKECKGGAPSKASTIDKAAPASPNSGVQTPPRG